MLDAIAQAPVRPVQNALPDSGAPDFSRSNVLFEAAPNLFSVLEDGRALDANTLRNAMTAFFGADDASGAWHWKDAHEAAVVPFLRRFGRARRRRAGIGPDCPRNMLSMFCALATMGPSHTPCSEQQVGL